MKVILADVENILKQVKERFLVYWNLESDKRRYTDIYPKSYEGEWELRSGFAVTVIEWYSELEMF